MMAKAAKKYYWLKLKEDFFEDDTIEWIEEQPGGEKYSLFYLKLCLKSLKTDGILIRNVGDMLIPYDIKKLAEITKTDIDTARVAMELFKNIGLVQILENGEIYMPFFPCNLFCCRREMEPYPYGRRFIKVEKRHIWQASQLSCCH